MEATSAIQFRVTQHVYIAPVSARLTAKNGMEAEVLTAIVDFCSSAITGDNLVLLVPCRTSACFRMDYNVHSRYRRLPRPAPIA